MRNPSSSSGLGLDVADFSADFPRRQRFACQRFDLVRYLAVVSVSDTRNRCAENGESDEPCGYEKDIVVPSSK